MIGKNESLTLCTFTMVFCLFTEKKKNETSKHVLLFELMEELSISNFRLILYFSAKYNF